jgi:hypothetical protein
MRYRLLKDKLTNVEMVLDREVSRGTKREESTKRKAVELLGKLAACRMTHAMLHIMTRNTQHRLGMATWTRAGKET